MRIDIEERGTAQHEHPGIDRREFLRGAAGLAGAAASWTMPRWVARASRATCAGQLRDIDHVVILIQENRSFDHYFGTYPGVRGFSDRRAPLGILSQAFAKNTTVAPVGRVLPYHLNTSSSGARDGTP